jgi:hypothetical protein
MHRLLLNSHHSIFTLQNPLHCINSLAGRAMQRIFLPQRIGESRCAMAHGENWRVAGDQPRITSRRGDFQLTGRR